MYVKLARFLALRPRQVLAFWCLVVVVTAMSAITGFGDPLWNRLASDVPQATPSESHTGQVLVEKQQTADYKVIAYVSGVDLRSELSDAKKLEKQLSDLKKAAESKGDEAKSLGDQAKKAADPALDLKNQAEQLGAEANSLGQRAKALGNQATALGNQATALGNQATALGNQAQELKAQAEQLGAQAQAAGQEAQTWQAKAQEAAQRAAQLAASGDPAGAAAAQQEAQTYGAQAQAAAQQAQSAAAQAKALGAQAQAAGAQAQETGKQARSLGERAKSLGAKAKRLGNQAQAKGNLAQQIGNEAKDKGDIAQDLANRAQALGDRAKALGDQAKALAEPDWPVSKALHKELKKTEAELKKMPRVKSVTHPFVEYNAMLDSRARELVAENGRGFIVMATLDLTDAQGSQKNPPKALLPVLHKTEKILGNIDSGVESALPAKAKLGDFRVRVTDPDLVNQSGINTLKYDLMRSESIGIPLSFLIMSIVFGGLIAAALPLSGALVAISTALAIMLGMTYLFEQQSFAVNVISVLGLGLSIDYGLLIVSRFREELARLQTLPEKDWLPDFSGVTKQRKRERLEKLNPRYLRALEITLSTAGRTSFFSALTVAIASSGMLFFRPELLKSLGIAGFSVVLLAMIASLTLVSSLMFLFAKKLDKPSWISRVPIIRRFIQEPSHQVAKVSVVAPPAAAPSQPTAPGAEPPGDTAESANAPRHRLSDATSELAKPTEATSIAEVTDSGEVTASAANASANPENTANTSDTPAPPRANFFDRFAVFVTRRPLTSFIVSAVVLVVACLPLMDLHLRNSLVDLLPLQNDQRILMEELSDQIPRATLPPLRVVARNTTPEKLDTWMEKNVADIDGVSHVYDAAKLGKTHDSVAIVSLKTQDFGSREAEDIVTEIRDKPHDFDRYVIGQAANQIDFVSSLLEGLPWVLSVLIVITFILLFLMSGSFVIPIQALVINTLSLMATLGISTLVFVDGIGIGLLGAIPLPGLESYVVVMLMCFGFGLSMDYELFLLSRMKEVWDETSSAKKSVIDGLSRSGRIVTSAATILVFVFLCFVTGEMIVLKEVGFILALAVAFDATIVRMVLVPSVMALFGRVNWWAPGPLRRLHNRVSEKLGHLD